MEININEIASVKIKEMEESGEIRKRIEDGIEKTINDAIDSACKSYKFRSEISEKIEKILQMSSMAPCFLRLAQKLKKKVVHDEHGAMLDSLNNTEVENGAKRKKSDYR